MRRNHRYRNGTVLIAVLACTVVSLSFLTIAVQTAMRSRLELRISAQREQTALLLHAGCLRAREQLIVNRDYGGEQWDVGEAFSGYESAVVAIVVEDNGRGEVGDTSRAVRVTAKLAAGSGLSQRTQMSQVFSWQPTVQVETEQ